MTQKDDTTTPQKSLQIGAIRTVCGRQTNFLNSRSQHSGNLYPGATLGFDVIDHSVFVFNADDPFNKNEGDVVLSICSRGFSLQEYLAPYEARALAAALNQAADHEDAKQQAMRAADWLASQEDATTEQVVA